ncbi:MAG: SelB C-terminal domain-containing protein, partial [Thermodesulfobacteriota bacterium]
VRGIQSTHLDADTAYNGQRAALNISGVGHREIERGYVVTCPELAPFSKARGRARAVDCLFDFTALFPGSRKIRNRLLKVHHLTDEALAVVRLAGGEAGPGGRAWGRLLLRKPMLMLNGDRFIVRDPSINATIGGGTVFVPYLSRDAACGVTRTAWPASGSTTAADAIVTLLAGRAGFDVATLGLMLNLRPSELQGLVAACGIASFLGEYVVNVEKVRAIEQAVKGALAAFHSGRPGEAGMGEDALYAVVRHLLAGMPKAASAGLFREVLSGLAAGGAVKRQGRLYGLAAHRPALAGADARIERALMALFSDGLRAPARDEISGLGFPKGDVARVMAYLQRTGAVVRIREGTYLPGGVVEEARVKLEAYIKANGGIKAARFRDLIGCGRKLAIEILEYFDSARVTLRSGDVRTLR